jgi:CBS domain-containing protein
LRNGAQAPSEVAMQNVTHLIESKQVGVISVAPDAMVLEAIHLMAEHGIGSVLVMRGTMLAGIVSERDYARNVALQGRASATTAVSDIMSVPVTVGPGATVNQCMQLMTDRRIRHLAVVDGERVIGLVSIGDLVKAVIEEQQHEIEQLHQYIAS